jgi:hypothetical protein
MDEPQAPQHRLRPFPREPTAHSGYYDQFLQTTTQALYIVPALPINGSPGCLKSFRRRIHAGAPLMRAAIHAAT